MKEARLREQGVFQHREAVGQAVRTDDGAHGTCRGSQNVSKHFHPPEPAKADSAILTTERGVWNVLNS